MVDRVVVEYLNGKSQSFMTKKSFDFFLNCNAVRLIPTTSRTYEQYKRLSETFSKFGCEYALLCNGGILLKNGQIDVKWLAETKRLAGSELQCLQEAEKIIRSMLPEQNIHTVENIMVYAKNDCPDTFASYLGKFFGKADIDIYYDSHKVYCFPASINKGAAIKRFSELVKTSGTVAAGDSRADLPMFDVSDIAILPSGMVGFIQNTTKRVWSEEGNFSDYICDVLSDILIRQEV